MTPYDIANKTKKVIQLNQDRYTMGGVYFNPYFLKDLFSRVPELSQSGLHANTSETETSNGTLVTSKIISNSGDVLKLGSVFLDGKAVHTVSKLIPIDRLIRYVVGAASDTDTKSVQKKEIERANNVD